MPSNAKRCQAMLSGAKRCQAIPSDAKRCQAMPSDAKRRQAMSSGAKRCQAAPSDAKRWRAPCPCDHRFQRSADGSVWTALSSLSLHFSRHYQRQLDISQSCSQPRYSASAAQVMLQRCWAPTIMELRKLPRTTQLSLTHQLALPYLTYTVKFREFWIHSLTLLQGVLDSSTLLS